MTFLVSIVWPRIAPFQDLSRLYCFIFLLHQHFLSLHVAEAAAKEHYWLSQFCQLGEGGTNQLQGSKCEVYRIR